MNTLREQAEQIVKDEYCYEVCDAMGRCCYIYNNTPNKCSGFVEEVERCLNEWATEDKAEDMKE